MHRVFQSGSAELESLKHEASLENLKAFFAARMLAWPHPAVEVEGGGLDIFEDVRGSFGSAEAFRLLPHAFDLVLQERDPITLQAALGLAIGLAETSEKTELSSEVRSRLGRLSEHVKRYAPGPWGATEYLNHLLRWYRYGV